MRECNAIQSRSQTRLLSLGLVLFCSVGGGWLRTSLVHADYGTISWLALVPLLLAVMNLRIGAAAICGAAWGLTALLADTLGAREVLNHSTFAALSLTLVPAAYGALGAWATRRRGFDPLFLALAWAGVELCLRPAGFDQGLVTVAARQNTVVFVLSQIGGSLFAAFLIALLIAGFLSALHDARVALGGRKPRALGAEPARRLVLAIDLVYYGLKRAVRNSRAPPSVA